MWISTIQGRFEYDNPRIHESDVARALSMQCRYNGHVPWFYSVAEHSIYVSHLVPRPLRLAALLHDAHEAYTGDLVAPFKETMPPAVRAWLAEKEAGLDRAVAEHFGIPAAQLTHPAVKYADAQVCAAEGLRFYGRDAVASWSWGERALGLLAEMEDPPALCCLSPEDAEKAWMHRLADLRKEML